MWAGVFTEVMLGDLQRFLDGNPPLLERLDVHTRLGLRRFVRERRCEMHRDDLVRYLEIGVERGDSLGISISRSARDCSIGHKSALMAVNFTGVSLPFFDVIFGYLSSSRPWLVLLALAWPLSQRELYFNVRYTKGNLAVRSKREHRPFTVRL